MTAHHFVGVDASLPRKPIENSLVTPRSLEPIYKSRNKGSDRQMHKLVSFPHPQRFDHLCVWSETVNTFSDPVFDFLTSGSLI